MKLKQLNSEYYRLETPEGFLHIHIDYDDNKKIHNIFLRKPPIGTTINSLTSFLGVALSKYFRLGGTIQGIAKHLRSVKSSKKIIVNENTHIESIPQAIEYALRDFENKISKKT